MYKVLLVDDQPRIREAYSRMQVWEECGFFIAEEASNGLHALEILKMRPIDVVITDINMPLMDGIRLLRKIHDKWPNIQVVLMSACAEFLYAREGMRFGAVDYMVKPVQEKELREVLVRLRLLLMERNPESQESILKRILPDQYTWDDELSREMTAYFEEHLDKNITLAEVALVLNMNKDYLGKIVKAKTGYHFRDLYNRFKIEYAKPMIRNGHYHVYEISSMLGFSSADYFTQLFKKVVGMTPLEFKKG